MLQTLRDKTSGWIATVILGLLTIPFAFFGIEQYMVQRSDTNVATVEAPPAWWASAPSWWPVSVFWRHEPISVDEFRTAFEQERQQRRAEQGEAFDAREFESVENKRAILDTLIDRKVQGMAADAAHVVVSDALVRKTIQEIPAFQVDGKFDLQRYRLTLASQVPAQTPAEFDREVRESLKNSMLSGAIASSNFVSTGEFERLVKLMGERRDISLLWLPVPTADAGEVSAAEVKAWYEAHPDDYRAPETVSIEYVELDAAAMPAPPPADEATLRARYEQEKNRFAQAEQRLASHILVRVEEDADAAAQQAAKAEAEKLAAQARAEGADFAALARAESDDVGSKASGGDLGWVGKGMMVGPFEDALFAMQPGQVSDPVKTEFGWHVIQLRDVKAGAQEPFEQVRQALAAEQAEADRERAFSEISGKLVDEVYKNPSSLAPAARALDLPVQKAGPFSRDSAQGIAANPAVKRAAFSEALVEDGTVSDPIELGPGHSVLIRVVGHEPEHALPLDQVGDQVVAAIRADRARKATLARADALLQRLRGGQSLDAVAEAESLPAPESVPGVPRGAPLPTASVTEAAFSAPAPAKGKASFGKVALDDGRVVLFAVTKVSPGDLSQIDAQQRQLLQQQIAQMMGLEDARAYVAALRKRMEVEVNEDNL